MKDTTEERLQWHPAFFAGLQIELKQDAWNLEFENEYQLGTKPMAIDVLVIKKKTDVPVQKNIGRIFRKYNILEYKSPTDYLSINDFYKVYGYACFYKSESQKADQRKIGDMTITFVVSHYPQKVIQHLKGIRGLEIQMNEQGIYYITGDIIPIQILIVTELSKEENLWLGSLTNHIKDAKEAEHLIREYGKYKNVNLYQSVMEIIVNANQKKFEEVQNMCNALMELVRDEIDAEVATAVDKTEKRVAAETEKMLARLNELNKRLAAESRTEDIIKAASDREYQQKLFAEYGI